MRLRFLFLVITFFVFVNFCSAGEFYYNVTLDYNSGDLTISSIDIVYLRSEPVEYLYGDYVLELRGDDGSLVNNFSFIVPNSVYSEVFAEGEIENEFVEFDEVIFSVFVPYDERVFDVVLAGNSSGLEDWDVSEFSPLSVDEDASSFVSSDSVDVRGTPYFWVAFFVLFILVIVCIVLWWYFYRRGG